MDQDIPAETQDDSALLQMPESGIVSLNIICRLCANPNERIIGIYSEEGISNDLANKMNLYLPVKVSENDTLPLQCCWSCASTVLAWHELVVASVEADRRLRGLEVASEKQIVSEEDFGDIDEPDSPAAPDDGSEPKSPAASLSVFCQEPAATTMQQHCTQISKEEKDSPSYNLQQHYGEVKKEEWIQTDVITDESLQKYIENIQNPFVDSRLPEGTTLRKIKKAEGRNGSSQKATRKRNVKVKQGSKSSIIQDEENYKKEETNDEGELYDNDDLETEKAEQSENYDFSCQYCPLMFVNEEDILSHVKQEHADKEHEFTDEAASNKPSNKKDRRKNTKLDHDAVNSAKVIVEGRIYYNCKICGKSLHSPYTYIWHMRIHTGERPYVCDLCGKQFRVSQGLVRHLRETHEGIKNFGCDICGRMFATRRNVEEHRRIHTNERPYICDLCGKSFKQKASLFVHNRSHTDSFPFRCSYCNQGFRTRPPLLIHVTRHTGEKPYPCDVCGRCFRIKYELKRHKLIHSEEKPFSCSECGLSFRQKRYLRNHNKINHNRTTPDEDDVTVNNKPIKKEEETESHIPELLVTNTEKESEEYHRCSVCSIKFSSKKFLKIHQYRRHDIGKPPNDENARSVCEFCKTSFKRRCDMLRHIKKQHVEKKELTKRRRRVDIEYKIFCDVCDKGFTRKLDMEKHRSKKHPDVPEPIPLPPKVEIKQEVCDELINSTENSSSLKSSSELACDVCDKEFKRKGELNRHLKEDHGQQVRRFRRNKSEIIAEYFCDVCAKGFTRKFDMQKHRKTKHPNEPTPEEEPTQQQKNLQLLKRCKVPSDDDTNYYKCEICSRIFRQSYNFMRHQTVHTGIRAYFCHICGKNFRVSGGLHRHITEHHYGVKKYECDVCGKSFAAKATRDDHRNIHTDARPFICDICGKAFRQKASLHIHKLFHTDNYRFSCNICGKKYRRASELKIHSWLHTGHKPHQCSMCGSRFRLRQDLKRHIKIHDKLNECVCNECGSTFSQERYLKNHKKTHRVKGGMLSFVVPPLPQLQ